MRIYTCEQCGMKTTSINFLIIGNDIKEMCNQCNAKFADDLMKQLDWSKAKRVELPNLKPTSIEKEWEEKLMPMVSQIGFLTEQASKHETLEMLTSIREQQDKEWEKIKQFLFEYAKAIRAEERKICRHPGCEGCGSSTWKTSPNQTK